MGVFLGKIYAGWMTFARGLGKVQLWLILTLFYVVVFIPIGLIYQLIHRLLRKEKSTNWRIHRINTDNLKYFRRQG